jgi:hypothetical protein
MIASAQPSRELLQRPEAQAIIEGKAAFQASDTLFFSQN